MISFWHEDSHAVLEDIVLQDVSSIYCLRARYSLSFFFLTLRKNRARYRSISFVGMLSTFRCSPTLYNHEWIFFKSEFVFNCVFWFFHTFYEFVCLRIRYFSKSTFISLFYRDVLLQKSVWQCFECYFFRRPFLILHEARVEHSISIATDWSGANIERQCQKAILYGFLAQPRDCAIKVAKNRPVLKDPNVIFLCSL